MPGTDETSGLELALLPPVEIIELPRGKRSREEFERDGYEEDDLDLLPRPFKKQKIEDRKIWKPRLKRSNSVDRGGSLLSISDRLTSSTALKKEDMKEFSVIAVFSREAFENFGKKWKAKMNTDSLELATLSSRKGVSDADTARLLSLQSKSVFGTDFQVQVRALLDNKTSPHVIAVIEGQQEMHSLSLKPKVGDNSIDIPYTRVKYIQGMTAKGSNDNKQSMSVYVREDMHAVYSISEEAVSHKSGKKISSVGVNYATIDGTKYRTLIVHIPNAFIGSTGKDKITHTSFQEYADAERGKSSPVVVTSYFGDTNYSAPRGTYTSPSMGGHLPSGGTLNPQSSGAQKKPILCKAFL